MPTTFSYNKSRDDGKKLFCHTAHGQTYSLMLVKNDDISAHIVSVDAQGEKAPLPDGYKIRLLSEQKQHRRPPVFGQFCILWSSSYMLYFKGKPVLKIVNQQKHSVRRARGVKSCQLVDGKFVEKSSLA